MRSKSLPTWAGRSQFQYEGSILEGTKIHFGQDSRSAFNVSKDVYAKMLIQFSGREVSIGTSRTDPPKGSLGKWFQENCTRIALASYIGPILVEEGYAERGSEPDRILIKRRTV